MYATRVFMIHRFTVRKDTWMNLRRDCHFVFLHLYLLSLCKNVPNGRKVRTLRPAAKEQMPLESVVLKSRMYDAGDAWKTHFFHRSSSFFAIAFPLDTIQYCRQSYENENMNGNRLTRYNRYLIGNFYYKFLIKYAHAHTYIVK